MIAGARVKAKWRPSLAMVVFAVLLTVLALPIGVIIWFRELGGLPSQIGIREVVALLVALLLTLILAAVLSRTITAPINALIARTGEIGRGGRTPIVAQERHGTRELAVLSQSYLDLAERLVERTEYVHSYAAHVSHELKSPLTAIRGSAELLRDAEMTPEERNRFLDHIIADSERLAALLDRLRELARAEVPVGGGGAALSAVMDTLRVRFAHLDITGEGALDAPTALTAEAALIVLSHLADNAAQHGAHHLRVGAEVRGEAITIVVADDGSGVSPGNRDRIFEPFFTSRRESGGTGMGLEIVRRMLEAHGGAIRLLPGDRGASFEITIATGP